MRDTFSLFYCEKDPDITNFLHTKAIEFEKRDRCRTYIYFDFDRFQNTGELRIVGFLSLALKTIKLSKNIQISNTLRKRLGNISDQDSSIVSFLLGQLARDSSYEKKYLSGNKMLNDCYKLINNVKEIIGGKTILIECKPDKKLCEFYELNGFVDITETQTELKQYIKLI